MTFSPSQLEERPSLIIPTVAPITAWCFMEICWDFGHLTQFLTHALLEIIVQPNSMHPSFVEEAVIELLAADCIEEHLELPYCVNPLSVAEGKKLKPVIDLRSPRVRRGKKIAKYSLRFTLYDKVAPQL
ncbi:hypothetical protein pdam_00002952 [Pocillopora damicornis]|uniref:Uncharacterized protein n=1 Tax=Pocillopora damicornis TaxID=46731 RepID=A0A3M6U935_POCDA|nr:hypothetical protein pdam_00002952 [Pocillopora damicornis]